MLFDVCACYCSCRSSCVRRLRDQTGVSGKYLISTPPRCNANSSAGISTNCKIIAAQVETKLSPNLTHSAAKYDRTLVAIKTAADIALTALPSTIATTSANIASAKLRRMGWVICSLFRQITGINQYAFQKVCAILGSSIARVKFIGQLCELKMYLSMCAKLQTLRWRTAKLFALFVLQHL